MDFIDGPLIYPGAFAKLSETPWKNKCCAPLIGEHNQDVYSEIGISGEEMLLLKQSGIV